MATTIDATNLTPCQVAQARLDEAFRTHPGAAIIPIGEHDALVSPQNRSAFIQSQNQSQGGKPDGNGNRTVQVRYTPAGCFEDEETPLGDCEFGNNEPVFKTANITVDKFTEWGFTLDENEYRDLCDGNISDVFAQVILARYQRARANYGKKIADELALLPGNYPTNGDSSLTSPISLPIVTSAGTYLPTGFGLLSTIYKNMNIYTPPMIIAGRGIPELALSSLQYSAPNTAPGYNVPSGFTNYFQSANLNDAFGNGTEHLLTFAPGAIQLLEWYKNDGNFSRRFPMEVNINGVTERRWSEEYTKMTMPDGITWDFAYKYDCGKHHYKFTKFFGVAAMPSDAFGDCNDFNYILNFLATCGELDCTDINAALAPAVSS